MKIPFGAKQYSGEKWVALFAKFLNSSPGRTADVRALPRSGQSAGRAAVVAPVWKPQLQHTVTWGHWRSTTAKSPSLGGMRKCEHNDFLTDLFYYERKIWDSSSLITVLTSDNSTPLLFNGNITHAILKMEKHFHVLFKSGMIYEMNRLCGVQGSSEKLMKSSFKGREMGPLIFFFFFNIKGGDVVGHKGEKSPWCKPGSGTARGTRTPQKTGFLDDAKKPTFIYWTPAKCQAPNIKHDV